MMDGIIVVVVGFLLGHLVLIGSWMVSIHLKVNQATTERIQLKLDFAELKKQKEADSDKLDKLIEGQIRQEVQLENLNREIKEIKHANDN